MFQTDRVGLGAIFDIENLTLRRFGPEPGAHRHRADSAALRGHEWCRAGAAPPRCGPGGAQLGAAAVGAVSGALRGALLGRLTWERAAARDVALFPLREIRTSTALTKNVPWDDKKRLANRAVSSAWGAVRPMGSAGTEERRLGAARCAPRCWAVLPDTPGRAGCFRPHLLASPAPRAPERAPEFRRAG